MEDLVQAPERDPEMQGRHAKESSLLITEMPSVDLVDQLVDSEREPGKPKVRRVDGSSRRKRGHAATLALRSPCQV
jgi:hypothetical protein